MTMTYDFQQQLKFGKEMEDLLDIFFSKWYDIEEVSLADEKERGIDRIFTARGTKNTYTIEYKADSQSGRTGNFYIEADIVQSSGNVTQGWARKTQADKVIYFAVPTAIYILDAETITENMDIWCQHREVKAQNAGYYSVGYLVPVQEIIDICQPKVIHV